MVPKAFSRFFRDKVGITYTSFSHIMRAAKACELFSATDLAVPEVSRRVGLGSVRTFDRVFRQLVGVSPRQFQRTARPAAIDPLPRTATGLSGSGGEMADVG